VKPQISYTKNLMQNSETGSSIMLPTCGDGNFDHVLKGFCISLQELPRHVEEDSTGMMLSNVATAR